MDQTKPTATGKIVGALIIGLIIGFALGAFWESRRSGVPLPSEGLATGKETTAASVAAVAPEKVAPEKTEMKTETKKTETVSAPSLVATPVIEKFISPALVFVENQSAGGLVEVTRVKSATPVWVAVRELKSGIVGNILGARRILAGENSAVPVELLRPTLKGGSYVVMLYTDNGDPAFNYREDILIPEVQGAFVAE